MRIKIVIEIWRFLTAFGMTNYLLRGGERSGDSQSLFVILDFFNESPLLSPPFSLYLKRCHSERSEESPDLIKEIISRNMTSKGGEIIPNGEYCNEVYPSF